MVSQNVVKRYKKSMHHVERTTNFIKRESKVEGEIIYGGSLLHRIHIFCLPIVRLKGRHGLAKTLETMVLTIGHSTRTLEEFVQLLEVYGVTLLVDVRTVPRSRHNPQFNKENLSETLKHYGVRYIHMPKSAVYATQNTIPSIPHGKTAVSEDTPIICKPPSSTLAC